MNKRTIFLIIGALLIVGAVVVALFYWRNLRGVGPALWPVPAEIEEVPVVKPTGEVKNEVPLRVAAGYAVTIFAKDLGDVRDLEPIENGYLASIPGRGEVVALVDADRSGKADETKVVLKGLNRPHGLALRCSGETCTLYVAETSQVVQFEYNPTTHTASNKKVLATLPTGGRHTSRSLLLAPEKFGQNMLLVSIGSACDVCREADERRATVMTLSLDETRALKPLAKGLRNAVFLAEHPTTGDVWVTEMGRDFLGDNLPPDEINILNGTEQNFGWPICYGNNVHDTSFDKNTYIRNPCLEPFETPPVIELPAHSAPLGLAFTRGEKWGSFANSLFVAYHGSWNRTEPTGYKVVRYELDESGKAKGKSEDFISGWLSEKGATGRPVDISTNSSGELFISDDKAGIVYKVVRP